MDSTHLSSSALLQCLCSLWSCCGLSLLQNDAVWGWIWQVRGWEKSTQKRGRTNLTDTKKVNDTAFTPSYQLLKTEITHNSTVHSLRLATFWFLWIPTIRLAILCCIVRVWSKNLPICRSSGLLHGLLWPERENKSQTEEVGKEEWGHEIKNTEGTFL